MTDALRVGGRCGGDPALDRRLLRPGRRRRAALTILPGRRGVEDIERTSLLVVRGFGGPARYTEELGGYENMLAHHRELGITPEQRFRFASLLSLAADDAALPDDPEFRSAFVAYVEWGTRIALHNSQPGAEVFEHAPVPRWGWGEAPPFRG